MNKNTKIKVQTPVGETEARNTGPIVTQGGVDSATISSVSIGNGISNAFEDSKEEIVYNTIPLSAISFMDDIFAVVQANLQHNLVMILLKKQQAKNLSK